MLARLALPLTIALLLSGCAGGPGSKTDQTSAVPSPTPVTVVADNRIAEPTFTDTLHLLAFPEATTRAPDAYTDLRVPIPGTADIAVSGATAGAGAARSEWRMQLGQGLQGIVGTATFWVEVRGTVLTNPNPLADHCFWEFRFLTGDVNTGESHFAPCVKENATVAEGVRAIVFTFDLPAASIPAGQDLRFELYSQDFGRAPEATVDLLTGSIVHDSKVQLAGLVLPLDADALLTTT